MQSKVSGCDTGMRIPFPDRFERITRRIGGREKVVILLMGVAGAGKTTGGKLLASQLGWEFADADDYHSATNVEKMRHGIPLTDADRAPWLEALRVLISSWLAMGKNAVLACSALKQSYRDILQVSPDVC